MRVFWHTDFTHPATRPGRPLPPLRHVVAFGEREFAVAPVTNVLLMEWEQLGDGAPWTRLVAFGDAFDGLVACADVFQALQRAADPALSPQAFCALLEAQGFTAAAGPAAGQLAQSAISDTFGWPA